VVDVVARDHRGQEKFATEMPSYQRHVRQRKLNTKQGLRVIRESEIEEQADDESQRHIAQVETGVEKGEEIVRASPLHVT